MPEKKISTDKLMKNLEAEFRSLVMAGLDAGSTQGVVDYAAYLTEKVTQAILEGRPDLAESFKQSAEVRAAALRLQISKNKSEQIAAFAGSTIKILAGVLL